MAYTTEKISNFGTSTLQGSMDGSTNPVSFQVALGSPFPAAANFRVVIDSEILLVTGRVGNVFTASRAQEGTAIAAHSAGAAVNQYLTTGSFFQLVGEQTLTTTAANRPAAGQFGRLFFASDGAPCVFQDTGSAWTCWANGVGPFTPPIGDFTTWVNQGTAAYDESAGYGYLTPQVGAGATNLVARTKAAGSAPWTLTLAARTLTGQDVHAFFCLVLKDAGTGRLVGFGRGTEYGGAVADTVLLNQWSSPTAAVGTISTGAWYGRPDLLLCRVKNDATTLFFQVSADWRNWHTIYSALVSGFYVGSITDVGYGVDSFTGGPNTMAVLNATLTHP